MKHVNWKKSLMIGIAVLFFMGLTGCSLVKQIEQRVTNEIINRYINYEENITVSDIEDALTIAAEKAEASVVGVIVQSGGILGSTYFGSGVIVKSQEKKSGSSLLGYQYHVVTNRHVIVNGNTVSQNVKIYLGQFNEMISGTVVSYDNAVDTALITFESPRKLSVATIGDSTKVKKAQFAIAIGNPYDYESFFGTVTVGHISHPLREIDDERFDNGATCINYYIQHDAAINGGNSGGGLFNLKGELIGLNTWKLVSEEDAIENIGFSAPIHIVMSKFSQYL